MARNKWTRLRKCKNGTDVVDYVNSIISGKKKACKPLRAACERFSNDLDNPAWDFRIQDAEFIIRFIETCIAHKEGERLDGTPLLGQPFILEPREKFIIDNLLLTLGLTLGLTSKKRNALNGLTFGLTFSQQKKPRKPTKTT